MERKLLDYTVFIEREGNLYNAYCKTLGLADFGKTISEATKRISAMIKFHIESLTDLGYPVPVEKHEATQVTTIVQIHPSVKAKLSYL